MVPAIPAEASTSGLESLMPSDEDLLYEEELLRNPYSLKMWWRYLEARKEAPTQKRHLLYERALKALPGSYKVNAQQLRRDYLNACSAHNSELFCESYVLLTACMLAV